MKKEYIQFACAVSTITGVLLLVAAYLLIWKKAVVMEMIRIAAAIVCTVVGAVALFGGMASLSVILKRSKKNNK